MGEARIGTFEELMDESSAAVQEIAIALRGLIRAADPGAVEIVRLGDGAATYGVGLRKMLDGYAYLMPQAEYVNLGFYQGARLADPARLLEGNGRLLRHVKIRTLADVGRPEVLELIAAALADRVATV